MLKYENDKKKNWKEKKKTPYSSNVLMNNNIWGQEEWFFLN
jgi:hypothetical protein